MSMQSVVDALLHSNGQQRSDWLNRTTAKANDALHYYGGPAADPIVSIAKLLGSMSPGADMMDMREQGGDLMAAKSPMGALQAGAGLAAATMGMAIPGTAKGVSEGVQGASRAFSDRERKFMDYMAHRTFRDEADARDKLSYYANKWAQPSAWELEGKVNPFADDFVNSIPLVSHGKELKIGAAGKSPPPPRPPFAASREPIGQAPSANWGGQDLQDYRKQAKPHETVENAYVSFGSIPKAQLAGGKTGYGWDELERFNPKRDAIPPVTLRMNKNGSTSIIDGNHRIEWFRQQGFDSIPAYVIKPK